MSMDTQPNSPEMQFWTTESRSERCSVRTMRRKPKTMRAPLTIKSTRRNEEQADLDAIREDREALLSRYGDGAKFSEALEAFRKWDADFRQNPAGASDRFARSYAAHLPRPAKAKAADEKPPEYLDRKGLDNWHREKAIRDAVREVSQRDNSDDAAIAKQRAILKEMFPDKSFREAVKYIVEIDAAASASPHHTAQRLAMLYGAPATVGHVAEQHRAVESERQVAALSQWLGQIVQSGALPGIEHPKMQAAIAEALSSPGFRTGNVEADLINAYRAVQEQVNETVRAENEKAAVEKARKASRSLSGSTSTEISDGDHKPGSAYDAARDAYRSFAA